ncbi:methyl-accepting chemotaxis protein [Desulfolutivibrio sp.]|uniref:methyl-accepting chemotaxis protein n=1 Tax=Desulfolutivibrio sp. TaxID=2773296 RepID=UPI002F96D349
MKFGNLRIGLRLLIGFASVIILFSIVAWTQIATMMELGELQDDGAKRAQDAQFIGGIDSRLEALYGIIADAVINGDLDNSAKDLAEAKAQQTKDLSQLREMVDTPEEKRRLAELEKLYTQYFAVMETKMLPLLRKEGSSINDGIKAIDAEIDDLKTKAMDNIDAILESFVKESQDADTQFDAVRTKSIKMAVAFSAVALLVGIVAGVVVTLSITRPLAKGVHFATDVADGKLDSTLSVDQKDEIGVLAEALRRMVQSLKNLIGEAKSQADMAVQKTREAETAMQEATIAKEQAERAKAEGMLQAAHQLEDVVEVVTSASEELSAQIEQSSRGSEEQSHRVGETATAMEEMNATVMEVAKNASQAAETADRARHKAEDGSQVVTLVVKGIGEVQDAALSLKTDMTSLGKQAESIGQILNVISDIADQTNLLALNAAIEAARAGEAGRGFAVVADEVRKLAEKTQTATKEVGDAIRGIQNGARTNIANVEQAVQKIDAATTLAGKSGEALAEIVTLVDLTTDQVRSIASASEQQSAASEEINRSIEDINRITSETTDAMQQSAQAVSELARQSMTLKGLIDRMKEDGGEAAQIAGPSRGPARRALA